MRILQRAFSLPPGDVEYLDSLDLEWETFMDGSARWLLIHGVIVPNGYNREAVTVALRIEPAYPDTQIDMAYFDPPLARSDGKGIRQLSDQQIAGRRFQRWSRHRSKENPWRPGIDDVSTHMAQVAHWLESELRK